MPNDHEVTVLADAFPVEWREPALGWDGLRAWESEHGVELPEPYRSFITEISNGSSLGPLDDGLLPLGWLPDDYPAEDQDPAADFPLTATWFWEEDASADPTQVNAVFSAGSVVLGTSDGPLYWLLVTTGPQRGKVWVVSEVGAVKLDGTGPDTGDGVGFGEWVACWAANPDAFPEIFTMVRG